MSRNIDAEYAATPPAPRKGEPQRPRRYPSLVKAAAVVEYCDTELHVKVTEFLIKRACESGRLRYSLISNRRCFAPEDVQDWILSLAVSA